MENGKLWSTVPCFLLQRAVHKAQMVNKTHIITVLGVISSGTMENGERKQGDGSHASAEA